ncbi:MAG: choice-of-anchor D domain-containing protein [Acidobacteria bacterium]|nr:choice-of-anchor D domain-containing protein [Acidobacteriota bacterium]
MRAAGTFPVLVLLAATLGGPLAAQPYPLLYSGPFVQHTVKLWVPSGALWQSGCTLQLAGQQFKGLGTVTIPNAETSIPVKVTCEEQLKTHKSIVQFDGVLNVTVPIDTPLLAHSGSALLAVTGSNFSTSAAVTGTVKVVQGFNAQSTPEGNANFWHSSNRCSPRQEFARQSSVAISLTCADSKPDLSGKSVATGMTLFMFERYLEPPGVPASSTTFSFQVNVQSEYDISSPAPKVDPAALEISVPAGSVSAPASFEARNDGGGRVEWKLLGSAARPTSFPGGQSYELRVDPAGGVLGRRQKQTVLVRIDATGMTGERTSSESVTLDFFIDQGRRETVRVNVKILPPGVVSDAVQIVRADPAPGAELDGLALNRITALVRHSLGSEASGQVALELLGPDDRVLAAGTPVLVQRGRVAENEMTLADVRFPAEVFQTTLRAVLYSSPGATILKEHRVQPYSVVRKGTDTLGLLKAGPDPQVPLDPREPVEFSATVAVELRSQAQAEWALQVFDQDDKLAASSEWFRITSRDGTVAREAKIPKFTPTGKSKLRLRAVLRDSATQKTLKQTDPVEYTLPLYRIQSIEFLQTVQRVENGKNVVPLVALKPMLGRVMIEWLGPDSTAEPVSGVLKGTGNDPSDPFHPRNSPLTPKRNPNRSVLEDSLYFELNVPGRTPLEREFELRDAKGNSKNIRKSASVDVFWMPDRILVGLVPVCYAPGPKKPDRCASFKLPDHPGAGFLKSVFPAGRSVDLIWVTSKPLIWWQGELTKDGNAEALSREIYKQYGRHIAAAKLNQLFGVLPDLRSQSDIPLGKSRPMWFKADNDGRTGWFQRVPNARVAQQILAHEMGHNFGLRHAGGKDFCAASNPVGWPYPDSTIQDPGWNYLTQKLVPASAADFMSNCAGLITEPVWASPHTATKLIESNFEPNVTLPRPPAKPEAATKRSASPALHLLVSGSARRDGSAATLDPVFFASSQAPTHQSQPEGNHCLEFTGVQPGRFCFDLKFETGDTWGASSGAPIDEQSFLFELDAPEGLERLALTRDGREMAALAASRGAPAIRIDAPSAGAVWPEGNQTLAWTASDADGDPLLFNADYSADDGLTWMPLESGLSEPRLELHTSEILGGDKVRFRVTASDGLRNAAAEAGPVTVRQRPVIKLPAATLSAGPALVDLGRDTEVTVENPGTGPLLIQSVSSDNPAFQFELPMTPLLVPAGASISLPVRFRPATEGAQSANLVLRSNDATQPEARLAITAEGSATPAPDTVVEPAALDFGSVLAGQSATRSFTVENRGTAALRIDSMVSSDPLFTIAGGSFPLSLGIEKTAFEVAFRPVAEGQRAARLTLRTNDPKRATIEIPLTGRGQSPAPQPAPAIQVSPASLAFGEVTVGQSRDLLLAVRNTGNATLAVSRVSSDNAAFTVVSPPAPFNVAPGAAQDVTVRLAPQAAGAQTGRLTIASNAANQPSLTVSLNGTGIAVPAGPQTPVLQIDDGVFETTLRPPEGASELHMVNRLKPASYPATLTKVQIYFHDRGDGPAKGASVGILYGSAAAESDIDGTRLRALARQITDVGKFVEYEVPPLTIESGDFVVGFHTRLEPDNRPAAVDITNPQPGRSLISRDGSTFSPYGINGVFGFRAVVSVGQ